MWPQETTLIEDPSIGEWKQEENTNENLALRLSSVFSLIEVS
jgi:hypothetical protein